MTQDKARRTGIFSSLRGKLLFWFLLVSLIPLIVLGAVAFISARNALQQEAFSELKAVEIIKTNQIETWLADRRGDALFARNLVVVKGTEGVNEGLPVLAKFKDDPANPAYVAAFKRAESVLGSFAAEIGGGIYEDIMLVDPDGDVVFAVNPKSAETNIFETGEVAPLVFQSGLQSLTVGDMQVNLVYEGTVNIKIVIPVLDNSGQTQGALILETNAGILNDIMSERTGLGESGETYLVGQDKLFRNDSRFLDQLGEETTILNPNVVVDTVASRSGLAGEHGIEVIDDYRGTPVLSSWGFVTVQEPTDIDPDGVRWALLTEIDQAEVNQPVVAMARIIGGLVIGVLVLVVIVAVSVSRTLSAPIKHVAEVARDVAGGDLTRQAKVSAGDEIGQMADAFNEMTGEISKTLNTLEQRTRQLEIIAVLGERLSSILNLEDLLVGTVNQIQENFGYYHAHIYLLDPEQENLVVAAGTGEAGTEMKEKGHSIPVDTLTSLVARAARTGEIIRVDNVREAPDWLPNPLLPNTYSEMAVPIMLAGQVVGVLDVQQDKIAGLDEGDAGLLRSLANQVAVAIRNARLFEKVETALAEAQAAQERYVEQAWDRNKVIRQNKGQVRFSMGESITLTDAVIAEARQQALTQKELALVTLSGDEVAGESTASPIQNPKSKIQNALVAPIILRNVPIGNLQLHGFEGDADLSDGDRALVAAIIDQVAQAAENLRLINETQERASREQLIGQVSDRLRRVPDLETLMKIGVEELSQVLGPDRIFVRFGSEAELGATPDVSENPIEDASLSEPSQLITDRVNDSQNGQGE